MEEKVGEYEQGKPGYDDAQQKSSSDSAMTSAISNGVLWWLRTTGAGDRMAMRRGWKTQGTKQHKGEDVRPVFEWARYQLAGNQHCIVREGTKECQRREGDSMEINSEVRWRENITSVAGGHQEDNHQGQSLCHKALNMQWAGHQRCGCRDKLWLMNGRGMVQTATGNVHRTDKRERHSACNVPLLSNSGSEGLSGGGCASAAVCPPSGPSPGQFRGRAGPEDQQEEYIMDHCDYGTTGIAGEAGAGVTLSWVETELIVLSSGSHCGGIEQGEMGAFDGASSDTGRNKGNWKQKSRVGGKRESREHLSRVMVRESRQQQREGVWVRLESTPVPDTTRPMTKEQVKMESANVRV
ncbi:hypothetical protein EDB86DRAFT_2834997 [Lactarius hatsudake]|nr:hypothetical protein EDB86DRAFT_2834997 [Lactarius hatsudake]